MAIEAHPAVGEVEPIISSNDKLRLPIFLVPNIFSGRPYDVICRDSSNGQQLELVADISESGWIRYTAADGRFLLVDHDGQIQPRSSLCLPPTVDVGSMVWEARKVGSSDRNDDPNDVPDAMAAAMLTDYYQRVGAEIAAHPGINIDTAMAWVDVKTLQGITGQEKGIKHMAVSKNVRCISRLPVTEVVVRNYGDSCKSMQSPGQVIFVCSSGNFIFDFNPNDMADNEDPYACLPVDPESSIEPMVEAMIERARFIGPDGVVYHSSKTINPDPKLKPVTILYRIDQDGRVIEETPYTNRQLKKGGFVEVRSPLIDDKLPPVARALDKHEQKTSARRLATGITAMMGVDPDDPAAVDRTKAIQDKIETLPEGPAMLGSGGDVVATGPGYLVNLIGRHSAPILTPTGQPTGRVRTEIGLNAGGNVVVIGENTDDPEMPVVTGDMSIQQGLNANILMRSRALTDMPLLGAIRYPDPNGATNKARVYFANFPLYPGSNVIRQFPLPGSALANRQRLNVTVEGDILGTVPDPAVKTNQAGVVADPESEAIGSTNALALRSIEIDIANAIINWQQPLNRAQFGKISDAEFTALLDLQTMMHVTGVNGITGLPDGIDVEFITKWQSTMEAGQTRQAIDQFVDEAVALEATFRDPPKRQDSLCDDYEDMMIALGSVRDLPTMPADGAAVTKVEQREPTRIDQYATPLHQYAVEIDSDDFTDPTLHGLRAVGTAYGFEVYANGYTPLNHIISLSNALALLLSPTKTMNTADIRHALTIREANAGLGVEAGDVVHTVFDGNSDVIGERILRRRLTAPKTYTYYEVENGQERPLDHLVQADIERELMLRVINREIDIIADQAHPGQFVVEAVTGTATPLDFDFDSVVELTEHVANAAEQLYIQRNIEMAAIMLADQWQIQDVKLADKLRTAYAAVNAAGFDATALAEAGRLTGLQISPSKQIILQLQFDDCIDQAHYIERRLVIDAEQDTVQLLEVTEKPDPNNAGQTVDVTTVDPNPMLQSLGSDLFESATLGLDADRITRVYEQHNNVDGKVWIHDPTGNLAVRRGNEVLVFDLNNSGEVMVLDAGQYQFAGSVAPRPASVVERRFFLTEVLSQPDYLSMLFDFGAPLEQWIQARMTELYAKEAAVTTALADARSKSGLEKLGLVPKPDMYANAVTRNDVLSLAIIMAMELTDKVQANIDSHKILEHPRKLMTGTFFVDTPIPLVAAPILVPFVKRRVPFIKRQRSKYREFSTVKLAVNTTLAKGQEPFVVVGPLTKEMGFGGIAENELVEIGQPYGMTYDTATKTAAVVTADLPFELNRKGRKYIPSADPMRFIDIFGKGHSDHLTYWDSMWRLLSQDQVGVLVGSTTDEDSAKILAEMLRFDTSGIAQGTVPNTLATMYQILMQPFPHPKKPTPCYQGTITELSID